MSSIAQNLIAQKTGCLLATIFGGTAILKGYSDIKNDNKVAGAAKIVFGALLAGGAVAYALHEQAQIVPPLRYCYGDPSIESHPSCSKVFEIVKGALERGEVQVLSQQRKFPALLPENYNATDLDCSVTNNGFGELECFLRGPNKETVDQYESKGFLDMHSSSGVWSHSARALSLYNVSRMPDIFKAIPGCETIQRLQVHFNQKA